MTMESHLTPHKPFSASGAKRRIILPTAVAAAMALLVACKEESKTAHSTPLEKPTTSEVQQVPSTGEKTRPSTTPKAGRIEATYSITSEVLAKLPGNTFEEKIRSFLSTSRDPTLAGMYRILLMCDQSPNSLEVRFMDMKMYRDIYKAESQWAGVSMRLGKEQRLDGVKRDALLIGINQEQIRSSGDLASTLVNEWITAFAGEIPLSDKRSIREMSEEDQKTITNIRLSESDLLYSAHTLAIEGASTIAGNTVENRISHQPFQEPLGAGIMPNFLSQLDQGKFTEDDPAGYARMYFRTILRDINIDPTAITPEAEIRLYQQTVAKIKADKELQEKLQIILRSLSIGAWTK